ncbi:hypothetical protein C9994_15640 [Marivirga lumbricoides]|uniref:Carboxypeptidase-like regulatory domain-containing protein n=1 Tax=Marivirga lumbricoides TaxID=1046115 RepID=A0A2T4DC07_9BACT|nr:hypothetical protein C9994_15640 [Marivirga lumbricoides]
MRKILLLLIFTIFCNGLLKAQLTGTLFSKQDNTVIEGAHIINTTKNQMAISSGLGVFTIEASSGDTLVISNISFNTKQLTVGSSREVEIWLMPADIQLDEVVVTNMPATQKAFKKRVIDMPMQDNGNFLPYGVTPGKPMGKIPANYDKNVTNSLGYIINKPVSFITKKLNKSYKEKVKYYEVVASQSNSISNSYKYNRELVESLTGLKDAQLTDFMEYLNLDNSFISKASEYEIAARIVREYEFYQLRDLPDSTSEKG